MGELIILLIGIIGLLVIAAITSNRLVRARKVRDQNEIAMDTKYLENLAGLKPVEEMTWTELFTEYHKKSIRIKELKEAMEMIEKSQPRSTQDQKKYHHLN